MILFPSSISLSHYSKQSFRQKQCISRFLSMHLGISSAQSCTAVMEPGTGALPFFC